MYVNINSNVLLNNRIIIIKLLSYKRYIFIQKIL